MHKWKGYFWLTSLVAGLLLLGYLVSMSPKEVDWRESYSLKHDRPMGTKLVRQAAATLFPDQALRDLRRGVATYFGEEVPGKVNLIFLNNRLDPHVADWEQVLAMAEAGSTVFMAARDFSDSILVALDFSVAYEGMGFLSGGDSLGCNFTNRKLRSAGSYWYPRPRGVHYFESYDSLHTTVLGINHMGQTNYVRIRRGAGCFLVHCQPELFTNHALLRANNADYIFKAWSYLPVAATYFDEKYKAGIPVVQSELHYILQEPALRWAWQLAVLGLLLFFIFHGKRKQRAIPVLPVVENTSLQFVDTLARLYYRKGNHLDIARKRYAAFLDHLRSRYFLDTDLEPALLSEELAAKSGLPSRSTLALIKQGRQLKQLGNLSREELHRFNRQLEYFYLNAL
ncbi:DUF4350 domain-containing protein [Geofilum rhodophaeum]|uniref:DUF4350 domain-containing protein n=1 Tax=Geofilum rhodophaeum TaxID=1965019 RepID=UPI000B51FB1A|nr:DUF4350 domain-containing protein [Geofilum rhodophaeum]